MTISTRVIILLKKLFIKDYQNTSDPQVRIRYGIAAGVFGVLTNVVLFLFKLLVGLMSNSITVIADAVNNLSDACSSVFTMVGFKLSSRPADKDHPLWSRKVRRDNSTDSCASCSLRRSSLCEKLHRQNNHTK